MKELKGQGLVSRIAPQSPQGFDASELGLADLADQLSLIAEELRRSDGPRLDRGRGPAGAAGTGANGAGESGSSIRNSAFGHDQLDTGIGYRDIAERRVHYARLARKAYAKRRRRSTIFGYPELFGEPAWDILLDLYIAHVEHKPVSVSSACIGSAAPPTTGLRWLGVLSDHGFILREHDPDDQRRVLVRLTDEGLAAMDKYFATTGE